MSTKPYELTQDERLRMVQALLVWRPQAKRCIAELDLAFRTSNYAAEPRGIAILAQNGMGKTTLLSEWMRKHPRQVLEDKTIVPVVSTTIPAKPTVKSLLAGTLYSLGDPAYNEGTTGNQEGRLINYLKKCETRMIHFDEMNHFVDYESQRLLVTVSNTLKNVIKGANVACVFTGLKYSDQIFKANLQLGNLFGNSFILEPFKWEDVDGGREFREFVVELERGLPLKKQTYFASREAAKRCHVACAGNLRLLMRLVRRAASECIMAGLDGLNHEVMEYAFSVTIASERRAQKNPYLVDEIPKFVPEPDDSFMLKLQTKR